METLGGWLPPLYGAGVIIFYAYGRFDEASYDTRRGLERLNSLLSVSRMRTASVVRLSFLYYVTGLLAIYVLVSAYVLVFVVTLDTGPSVVGGVAPGRVRMVIGDGGMVFLAVALAVVGLGPNMPFLRNVEVWLRRSAHGLAGIPTSVLTHAGYLLDAPFEVEDKNLDLFPSDDRSLLVKLKTADKTLLRDVTLIAAVGAWVLNSRNVIGDSRLREAFSKLEDDLRRRKRELFRRLNEESGLIGPTPAFGPTPTIESGSIATRQATAKQPDDKATNPPKPNITAAAEADELADDMCVLLALYREHGLLTAPIPPRPQIANAEATSNAATNITTEGPPTEHYSANLRRSWELNKFVGDDQSRSQRDQMDAKMAMLAVSWAFGVVVTLSLIWSVWPGVWEQRIRFPDDETRANIGLGWRLLERVTDGLFTTFLPVAFGIGIWQGATASRSWGDGLGTHWTQALPTAVFVLATSWLIGTFFLCGFTIMATAVRRGEALEEVTKFLVPIFQYQSPAVLQGAFLAVLVVGCLDRWQAGNKKEASGDAEKLASSPGSVAAVWHSFLAAIFVGLIGGLARLHQILFVPVAESSWPAAYQAGVVFYAAIYSALIAFSLLCGLSSALRARDAEWNTAWSIRPAAPKQPGRDSKEGLKQKPPAGVASDIGGHLATGSTLSTALLIAVLCVLPAPAAAQQITIGVREEARLYVWVEKKAVGRDLPRGYLWDVCEKLVVNAGLTFTIISINAERRGKILNREPDAIPVDLLCDPTTISLKRLERFISPLSADVSTSVTGPAARPLSASPQEQQTLPTMRFSPIFHLANRGYLERAPQTDSAWLAWWSRCINKATWKKMTAAGSAAKEASIEPRCLRLRLRKDIKSGEAVTTPPQEWIAVEETTSAYALFTELEACSANATPGNCLRLVSGHQEAAEVFCTATTYVRYYGDIELVKAAVKYWDDAHPARNGKKPCTPEQSTTEDVYEPYALLISNAGVKNLDQRLTLELYRLANESRLSSMLQSHMPEDAKVSQDQETLFRILKIPSGIGP